MSQQQYLQLVKNCPFCGEGDDFVDGNYKSGLVTCHNCGETIKLEIWETRPVEDALTAKIAELEQENACLREELQKLKSKEKPIRFGSLADWRRE